MSLLGIAGPMALTCFSANASNGPGAGGFGTMAYYQPMSFGLLETAAVVGHAQLAMDPGAARPLEVYLQAQGRLAGLGAADPLGPGADPAEESVGVGAAGGRVPLDPHCRPHPGARRARARHRGNEHERYRGRRCHHRFV